VLNGDPLIPGLVTVASRRGEPVKRKPRASEKKALRLRFGLRLNPMHRMLLTRERFFPSCPSPLRAGDDNHPR